MADIQYPFEEFMRHVEELTPLLKEEREALNPRTEEDGSVPFEWNVIRVFEYMRPLYSDERERQYKMQRYCLIMHYLAEHFSDFDQGDFAVYGSPKVGGLVGKHLFKALHHFFTTQDLSMMGHGPSPQEVLELAARFREDTSVEP